MASSQMSIQERIRALNLQQEKGHQSSGSGNTPPRQSSVGHLRSSFDNNPASPRQKQVTLTGATSTTYSKPTSQTAPSSSSSPPSEKAQLFKAAKVIQKSSKFEANRTRVGPGAYGTYSTSASTPASLPQHYSSGSRPSSNGDDGHTNVYNEKNNNYPRPVNAVVNAISSEDSEELDASAALQFWKTKGITNDGPLSYKQAKKKGSFNTSKEVNSNKVSDSSASEGVVKSEINEQGVTNNAIDSIKEEAEEQEEKPPSPPDIVRTADADFSMEQTDAVEGNDICEQESQEGDQQGYYDQGGEGYYQQNDEEEAHLDQDANVQPETPKLATENEQSAPEEDGQSSRHARSSSSNSMDGAPAHRAYTSSRRSRNRSSRRNVTSPDNRSADAAMFGDGAQSVVSAQSAMSSQTSQTTKSTLSSRATRFLREKNKRKGAASVATSVPVANDVGETSASVGSSSTPGISDAQKLLREKASKARMRQKAASSGSVASGSVASVSMASSVASSVDTEQQHKVGGDLNLKSDSSFDETRKGRAAVVNDRPQTIDLHPSIPNVGHHYASPPPPPPPLPLPEVNQLHNNGPSSIPNPYPNQSGGAGSNTHPPHLAGDHQFFDHAPSADESSCSELKAMSLFGTSEKQQQQQKQQQRQMQNHSQIKKVQPISSPRSEATSPEFATFPQGKSFDNGCQMFDALNPLLESAINALSPGGSGHAPNIFGTVRARNEDAPSDEDVAIEVEYVEQGEEPSYAETDTDRDSVFSMSTRDIDSYSSP